MKSILSILIIILLLPAVPLSAQEEQETKDIHRHEIGIGLVNLFNAPTFLYPPYPYMDLVYYPYYPYYPNRPVMGLTYRLHSDAGAWRLGTEFYSRTESSDNEYSESENSEIYLGIHSGYELHKSFKRLQLYYGADMFTNYRNNAGEYKSKDDDSESSNEEQHLEIGAAPFIGVRYFVMCNLSLSTETQFRASYFQKHYRNEYNDQENSSFSKGFTTGFAPLGRISLNIHF